MHADRGFYVRRRYVGYYRAGVPSRTYYYSSGYSYYPYYGYYGYRCYSCRRRYGYKRQEGTALVGSRIVVVGCYFSTENCFPCGKDECYLQPGLRSASCYASECERNSGLSRPRHPLRISKLAPPSPSLTPPCNASPSLTIPSSTPTSHSHPPTATRWPKHLLAVRHVGAARS